LHHPCFRKWLGSLKSLELTISILSIPTWSNYSRNDSSILFYRCVWHHNSEGSDWQKELIFGSKDWHCWASLSLYSWCSWIRHPQERVGPLQNACTNSPTKEFDVGRTTGMGNEYIRRIEERSWFFQCDEFIHWRIWRTILSAIWFIRWLYRIWLYSTMGNELDEIQIQLFGPSVSLEQTQVLKLTAHRYSQKQIVCWHTHSKIYESQLNSKKIWHLGITNDKQQQLLSCVWNHPLFTCSRWGMPTLPERSMQIQELVQILAWHYPMSIL